MLIAGVDEAGRGPLAGPVVAAAVILPDDYENSEIRDSKKLSKQKRDKLYEVIKRDALEWAIVAVGHKRIDHLNIRNASLLAMRYAVIRIKPDMVYVDGNAEIPMSLPQKTIIGGDSKVLSISAASVLAKVYRDRLMNILNEKYPGYGFAKHAGYPTKIHKEAISAIGPSKVHRRTFKGVKEFI